MHIPYRLTFVDLPRWAALARPAHPRRRHVMVVAALALGLATLVLGSALASHPASPPVEAAGTSTLAVTSEPPGAEVHLDGRLVGRTPAQVLTTPGAHVVKLHHPGALDVQRLVEVTADGAGLDQHLWRDDPVVQRLRPVYPGASIATATFLADGRILLGLSLPGADRATWTLDPQRGTAASVAAGTTPSILAPDGQTLATLDGPSSRANRLSIGRVGAPAVARWQLPAAATGASLLDLAWAPGSRHLVLVGRDVTPTGVARSTLRWLEEAGGEPVLVATLPAEVIPGSFDWSPDGARVAFLVRTAQTTALCVAGADGSFRYLADVAKGASQSPAFPPVAWSPDGARLAFSAFSPDQPAPSPWPFSPPPPPALFSTDLSSATPVHLSDSAAGAPVWRPEGLLTLAPTKKGDGLTLRSVDGAGGTSDLTTLSIRPGSAFAARWDLAHAQVIVETLSGSQPPPDYWLVRFAPQAGS